MEAFKAGDIVRLKSGGPKMTVKLVSTESTAHCFWFNTTGDEYKLEAGFIAVVMLAKVPESKGF